MCSIVDGIVTWFFFPPLGCTFEAHHVFISKIHSIHSYNSKFDGGCGEAKVAKNRLRGGGEGRDGRMTWNGFERKLGIDFSLVFLSAVIKPVIQVLSVGRQNKKYTVQ